MKVSNSSFGLENRLNLHSCSFPDLEYLGRYYEPPGTNHNFLTRHPSIRTLESFHIVIPSDIARHCLPNLRALHTSPFYGVDLWRRLVHLSLLCGNQDPEHLLDIDGLYLDSLRCFELEFFSREHYSIWPEAMPRLFEIMPNLAELGISTEGYFSFKDVDLVSVFYSRVTSYEIHLVYRSSIFSLLLLQLHRG